MIGRVSSKENLRSTNKESAWPDKRLVRACCKGSQTAWSALIDRYKNLIFSVPIKFGLSRDDAADVFQAVCVELLASLPRLRESKALPKWLMQTSFHQCLRWKRECLPLSANSAEAEEIASAEEPPEEMIYQIQREQLLRDAIAALPTRCNRMVKMLFLETPPRPYDQIAKELELAIGSIGFIRGRCLQKLRRTLEEKGFQ
jgi:RNA polymerase sigma factor (sigma-70 family)